MVSLLADEDIRTAYNFYHFKIISSYARLPVADIRILLLQRLCDFEML